MSNLTIELFYSIVLKIYKYIINNIYKFFYLKYFKVAPKKEVDENDKPNGEKKDAIIIEEKKEAPLATSEA